MQAVPTVFIVDDELEVQRSLQYLLQTAGYASKTYYTAEAFLDDYEPEFPGCLILDIRMPGMSGLELQSRLKKDGIELPIIMMTGHATVVSAVRGMQDGAFDFIEKPYEGNLLLQRIEEAIERDSHLRAKKSQHELLKQRYSRLTPREREVLPLLLEGKTTKMISSELEISTKTVDVHRARLLEKMQVENPVELIRLFWECDALETYTDNFNEAC